MIIKEYRFPLPFTLEEFELAQLYAIQVSFSISSIIIIILYFIVNITVIISMLYHCPFIRKNVELKVSARPVELSC